MSLLAPIIRRRAGIASNTHLDSFVHGRGKATLPLGAIVELLVFGVDGGRRVVFAVVRYLAVVLGRVAADSDDKKGRSVCKRNFGEIHFAPSRLVLANMDIRRPQLATTRLRLCLWQLPSVLFLVPSLEQLD